MIYDFYCYLYTFNHNLDLDEIYSYLGSFEGMELAYVKNDDFFYSNLHIKGNKNDLLG